MPRKPLEKPTAWWREINVFTIGLTLILLAIVLRILLVPAV